MRTAMPRGFARQQETAVATPVFCVLWAAAHLGHVLRNVEPSNPLVWLVAAASILLLVRPSDERALAPLAIAYLAYTFSVLPAPDNHTLIAAVAHAGLLGGSVSSRWRTGAVQTTAPFLRWVALIPYAAATLAKFNSGFFSEHSCAVELCNASLGSPALPGWIVIALPWLVAAAELAVVVLLLVPRTRVVGVAWATVLHLVMAISPTARAGLGFTLLLYALLLFFLPDEGVKRIHHRLRSVVLRIRAERSDVRRLMLVSVLAVMALVLGGHLPLPDTPVTQRTWWLVAPITAGVAALLLDACWHVRRTSAAHLSFRVRSSVALVLLGLLTLNAAAPYLGGRSVATFTMYSNLQTARGHDNHWLVPRAPWAGGQDDLVAIEESSSPYLTGLANRDGRISYHELRRRLASHPDDSVTYVRDGRRVEVTRAGDHEELSSTHPVWHRLIAHAPVYPESTCRW